MIVIFTYIIIPSIFVLGLIAFSNRRGSAAGSDHAAHLSIIQKIKDNKHRFISNYLLCYNEKHPFYPQLYHWLLSFLPERIYRYKYHYINLAVKGIEIIAFNAFLFYLHRQLGFEEIVFLYANIVFNAFPFSYAGWNAKNKGLSARGIGLIAGQVYLYLLVAYLFSGSLLFLPAIFMVVFISMLLSQMALQLILLSLPLVVITFSIPEILPFPFLAYGLFYLVMPKVAKNYIIGQFNHKRNYALFTADIFILKSRPGIYRDFVWDFWVRLKDDWRRGLLYIYTNPLVELVYGFIFLWFVVYAGFASGFGEELNLMYKLILISLGLFFLTSFRLTRFLGEPQRYVEFAIPLISVLFAIKLEWQLLLPVSIAALFLAFVPGWAIKQNLSPDSKTKASNLDNLLAFLIHLQKKNTCVFISNDHQLLKHIAGTGHFVCTTDFSRYYKNKSAFYQYHHDHAIEKLSPYALTEYHKEYAPDFLIINNDFYSADNIKCHFKKLSLVTTFGQYELFSLK